MAPEISEVESKYTNVVIDSQILTAFMSCERYCNLRYNRHLVPIGGPNVSMLKGSLAHIGIHKYFEARINGSTLPEAEEIGKTAMRRESPKMNIEPDEKIEVFNTVDEWFQYRRGNWRFTPLAVEKVFKVLAYVDKELELRIILTGRIDLIEQDPSTLQIYPEDHKTEAETWFYSQLSNQFKIYCLALGVNQLIVNRVGFQKSKKPAEKFKSELITFDQDCLAEFKNEVIPHYVKRYLIAESEGYFAPNYSSCINGHFACDFSDKPTKNGICHLPRNLREEKLLRFFKVEEWSPENL